ncbi:CBASS oligonucleotide cyclase [Streptomyces sp. NPDC001797]|uniref:CBASS oligonucleotide cyclase n=2 Tax=unclassified Streptomyces TaxID=2593676 RepID=UPI0036BCE924
MAAERHVDHKVLETFAETRVNVPAREATERRRQVNHLRERLEGHIAAHPDFDLVKLRASGSTAKFTAIQRRGGGSDADVAAYLRTADPGVDEASLLEWLRDRCIQVYGDTKVADDFKISDHAVGITLRGSGLKIDVAPVLYTGEPDDKGYLVTRQGTRVLTSVTLHLRFIEKRKSSDAAGPGYTELIRLLKAWIRQSKLHDPDLRCKSFLLELLVAHLWETGWNGEPLQVNDYPRAIEQVLAYIARTGLERPIVFTDFYPAGRRRLVVRLHPGVGPRQSRQQRRRHLHRAGPPAPGRARQCRAGSRRLGGRRADAGRGERRLARAVRPHLPGSVSMTGSSTRSSSFTLTDARYVGAKIGADLRLLNGYYGAPALAIIDDYVEEVALLLRDGYLDTVDYGFRETATNTWKLRLRYKATLGGQLTDGRPGSLPRAAELAGYGFHSYLTYSTAYGALTAAERAAVKEDLPIKRTAGHAPTALSGTTTTGHGYARNGAGVGRDVYLAH